MTTDQRPTGDRWYDRAAFLGERLARLGETPIDGNPTESEVEAVARAWSKNVADGDTERFERRLRSLGITATDLQAVIRAPSHHERPAWAIVAETIGDRASRADGSIDWILDDRIPFASLLQPWVDWAVESLRSHAATQIDLDPWVPSLERSLRVRLRRCGEPAVLHVYRRSGCGYREWILRQRADAYRELLDALPVWGRLAAVGVMRWVDAMSDLVDDLVADDHVVRARLLAGDPSPIVGVELTGDLHAGGRQVALLTTAAGGRVVYKPRSLSAEQVVADAGAHLRRHGGLDVDPVAPILDRGDHGWMGWIEACPPDADTMTSYSRRAGSLLALARALAITDLHDENLLPAGDRPVLVDLECLATSLCGDRTQPLAGQPSQGLLQRSVLASDLLVDLNRFAVDGRDISGLTGFRITGEPDTVRSYVWTGLGTDDIDLTRRLTKRSCDEPAVMLDVEAVVEGLLHTDAVIAAHGLGIDLDRRVDVRVLVHDTSFYAGLLDRSLTPKALADGLSYSIDLEQVARAATADDAAPWHLAAATAERELLEGHDIPLFTVDWNDTTGRLGGVAIPDLVHERGTATIAQRLTDTAMADRSRLQADLTRTVLDVRLDIARERAGQRRVASDAPHPDTVPVVAPKVPGEASLGEASLEVCRAIAEHLEHTAVADDAGGMCWLDIDIPSQFPAPILTDHGLCAGNAGVAVFLAALAATTGDTRWFDLAVRASAGDPPSVDIDLYSGVAGRGYALTIVGALLDEPAIVTRGVALLRRVPPAHAAGVKPLDLLFGLPGVAGALGAAAVTSGDDGLAAVASDYAHAVEVAWRAAASGGMRERSEAHRIGVAHGVTGIELALARVHQATGEPGLVALIAEMIEAENERVDRRGGVPARLQAVDRSPDRGWCWGAAGYVMAREAIAEVTGLAAARHAVERGRAVALEGVGPIDRLCCGRAAQADVLGPGNEHLDELVRRRLRWRFEGEATHQNASLLRGVSGVGLALLRSASRDRLPQPLRLDPVIPR